MKRTIEKDLLDWKASPRRKPLVVRGARQVGKTWVLKDFGAKHYRNVVHVDFERQPEFRQFFESTLDPQRIVQNLAMATGSPIDPETTLLVLDEIQECPGAIASLKYFCEDAPGYHVASAGSLIGLTLAAPSSYPVGKVNVIDMAPLSFEEFLEAVGAGNYVEYLRGIERLDPIPDAFFNPLEEQLRRYLVVGGFPEAVAAWAETGSVDAVERVLRDLDMLYRLDFHKHAPVALAAKLDLVWESIPSQLARENKKFLYRIVRESARAREYEDAVQWLVNAQTLIKVARSKGPGLPMSAYDDASAFKLYLLDVGLLRSRSGLAPSVIAEGDRLYAEFEGALAENFVLQEIVAAGGGAPRYWAIDNPRYEVDFLVQRENAIVPIEVKAGENVKARSLKKYRAEFGDKVPLAVRLSLRNLSLDGGILNVPLFMAGELNRLVGLAS